MENEVQNVTEDSLVGGLKLNSDAQIGSSALISEATFNFEITNFSQLKVTIINLGCRIKILAR